MRRLIYVILGITALLGFITMLIYNKLVGGRNKVREAWSGIDVQLQRRYSLIPQLTEIVKGYAAHEKQIFDDLLESREKGIEAHTVEMQLEAEVKIDSALKKILDEGTKYPELKANTNFLELQKSLADIEDNIQRARRYYNAVVRDYNSSIEKFPAVIFADSLGFKAYSYFDSTVIPEKKTKIQF